MATVRVVDVGGNNLGPSGNIHIHVDPRPDVPFGAFVQLMVKPIPSGQSGEGDGGVVRAANFKGQLVIDPTTLQPTIRWHWDLINESNFPMKTEEFLLVVTN
jgi:hypothetical protein